MSYTYPPNNQVNLSWVGFSEYTYPSPTSTDLAWYSFGCDYVNNVPASPNVYFVLDPVNDYVEQDSTNLVFNVSNDYTTLSGNNFNYAAVYTPQSGSQTDFYLVCDVSAIEPIFGQSILTIEPISVTSEITHWDTPWLVSGSALIQGIITASANYNFYSVIQIGQEFDWVQPLDITWQGHTNYTPPTGLLGVTWNVGLSEISSQGSFVYLEDIQIGLEVVQSEPLYFSWERDNLYNKSSFLSWGANLGPIVIEAEIAATAEAFGSSVFEMYSDSVIDRGNTVRSFARIRTQVTSVGYLEMTPVFAPASNVIGSNSISSTSGLITVCVIEVGQNMQFSDFISHLRGRVIFGYPEANLIRQAYEISNDRSMDIPNVPEDPCYGVHLKTTDYDLNDVELRRGTVDIQFTFSHDVGDIKRISVWVMGPDGHAYRDKMKIVDYANGNYDDHILFDPFKKTAVLNIPVHCIGEKDNQFYVEVEYKNSETDYPDNKPRVMRKEEKYLIPFQAQFDNRTPYLNLADNSFVNGPQSSPNKLFTTEHVTIGATFYAAENDSFFPSGQGANPNTVFTKQTEFITQIYYVPEDDYFFPSGQGANPNTYFIREYVDLSSTQIGG
jgi:hypothetical protein